MRTLTLALITVTLAAAGVRDAAAHHSFAPFNMEAEKTISGTIKKFDWTNPHTWIWLDVTNDKGVVETWGIEGMSPNFLGRRGWSKNTFEPGDHVKVVIWPLKSGEPGGTLQRATLPDGSEVVNFGGAGGGGGGAGGGAARTGSGAPQ